MSPATLSASGTLVASFLFVDLVGYSELTTAEQYAGKRALSAGLLRNLGALRPADYRIRETGDGAWIAFLSNPEHALYMALAIARGGAPQVTDPGLSIEKLRIGINLGTVKEAIDLETRTQFIGDGINAAKRVMDFARPGEIRASRSFHDAVANLDRAYLTLFTPVAAGARDEGAKHDAYVIRPSDVVLKQLESDLAKLPPKPAAVAQATDLVRKWFSPLNTLIRLWRGLRRSSYPALTD